MNRRHAIPIILLTLITIIIFSNTFMNAFMWDDDDLIVENRYIKDVKYIPYFFTIRYWKQLSITMDSQYGQEKGIDYRPISMISFSLDYFLWKLNPFGYHLSNLLFHIVNVILIYILVSGLAGMNEERRYLPFLAALIFAAHPIHTESITWIKNRSDLLALVFFLSSLLLFIRYTLQKKVKPAFIFYSLSIISFILALFSKEMAITLPIMLVLYAVCFIPKKERKGTIAKALPFFGIAALYVIFKVIFLDAGGGVEGIPTSKVSFYPHILIVIKTLGCYIKLLVFPFKLNAEYIFHIPRSFFERGIILSVISLVLILVLTVRLFKYSKLAIFAILWLFITLVPASNIIFLITRPIAEQRLYIPSLGFSLLLALGIMRLRWKRTAALLAIFIITLYSFTTMRRNLDWRDSITFWTKTVEASPDNYRAYNNLGRAYSVKERYDEAIKRYEQALRLNPHSAGIHNNIGTAYESKNLYDEAIKKYKEALKFNPMYAGAHYNIGNLYDTKGYKDEAIKEYNEAIKFNPYNVDAHNNLANVYEKQGFYEDAIREYKEAINLDPRHAGVRYNLGRVYQSNGLYDEAIKEYKATLRLNPKYVEACNNLGYLYIERDVELDEGVRLIEKALSLAPDNPEIMDSLGWAYYKKGMLDRALELLEKAIMLLPDNTDVQEHLTAVYKKKGIKNEPE